MDDLDKQIEEAKERLKKTQQLAELNALQVQAAAIGKPQQPNQQDPMFKMMKYAFPIGLVFVGIGLVVFIIFHNWTIGLTLDALGAVAIGVKVALTPSIRIPIIDDRGKPKQAGQKVG